MTVIRKSSSIPCHVCFIVTILSNVVTYQITLNFLLAMDSGTPNGFVLSPSTAFEEPSWSSHASSSSFHVNHPSGYQLAYNHSMGFFDTITDSDWTNYYQKPVLEHLASLSNSDKNDDDDDVVNVSHWLYHHMIPNLTCPHSRKVGNPAGKWMCDPERWVRYLERRRRRTMQQGAADNHSLPCLVYSIGSKGNFRWEEEFVEQFLGRREDLCEFHIFDPSPVHESAQALQQHPHWHYHAWGLRGLQSTKNYTRRRDRFLDFTTIRQRLGHQHRPIDVFKIDCEGCEWESMPDWLLSGQYPASDAEFPDLHHVLLETHSLPLPNAVRTAGNFGRFLPMPQISQLELEFAKQGFVLYAKEVNTHKGLGRSVEFGFLRMHPDFFVMASKDNNTITTPRLHRAIL